jgi:uncharacterized membrane protein
MHDLLHRLVAQYALANDKAARLWQLSHLHDQPSHIGKHTERGLGMVAALLLGAGLIFWIAANWQDQSRQFKLYLIQGVLLASMAGATAWPRGRNALLLLATLALGGLLAFIGQTYQTGADPWQLFAAWAALALLWVVAARSDGLWAVWVLIVGMGIALWSGDHLMNPIANVDRMFWGHRYRSYLTPLLWALLVLVIALVTRISLRAPSGQVTRSYALRLAVIFALGAWCTYGLWDLFREQASVYMVNALLVVGTAVIAWFAQPRDITLIAMVVLALDAMFLGLVLRIMFYSNGSSSDPIGQVLFFGLVAAVTVGFSGQWIYKLQKQEGTA